jgi:predicted TIM-barrel fold metal-dependent hydrolase
MRIIDAHVHIYPEKIAAKASAGISAFYDGMLMRNNGGLSMLQSNMQAAQVTRAVICSVATKAEQVDGINRFLLKTAQESNDTFTPLMALHPEMQEADIIAAVDAGIKSGFSGVKLHPDFQRFRIDDRNLYKIYDVLQGTTVLMLHMGDKRMHFSEPQQLAAVLKDFPRLIVHAAHFGGYSLWDEAVASLAGNPNVFVDTASSMFALLPEKTRDIIRAYGADHVMFGSDYPMWNAVEELALLDKVNLTDSEMQWILQDTAERLYFSA